MTMKKKTDMQKKKKKKPKGYSVHRRNVCYLPDGVVCKHVHTHTHGCGGCFFFSSFRSVCSVMPHHVFRMLLSLRTACAPLYASPEIAQSATHFATYVMNPRVSRGRQNYYISPTKTSDFPLHSVLLARIKCDR